MIMKNNHQDILRSLAKTVLVRLLAKKQVLPGLAQSRLYIVLGEQAGEGEEHLRFRDHGGPQPASQEVGSRCQVF